MLQRHGFLLAKYKRDASACRQAPRDGLFLPIRRYALRVPTRPLSGSPMRLPTRPIMAAFPTFGGEKWVAPAERFSANSGRNFQKPRAANANASERELP